MTPELAKRVLDSFLGELAANEELRTIATMVIPLRATFDDVDGVAMLDGLAATWSACKRGVLEGMAR